MSEPSEVETGAEAAPAGEGAAAAQDETRGGSALNGEDRAAARGNGADPAAAEPEGGSEGRPAARPDWLPEAFWDEARGQVIPAAKAFVDENGKTVRMEALFKSYDEARRELNRTKENGRPPKEYALNLPEDVPVPAWLQGGGPVEEAVLAAAKESGIPQKALDGIIRGYLSGAISALEQEMTTLKAESRTEEVHARRLSELAGRVQAAAGGDEETEAVLRAWASTAKGVALLEQALDGRLADRARRYVAVPGAGQITPAATAADKEARAVALTRTDAYRHGDKAVHDEVRRLFEEVYPGEQPTAALNPSFAR